MLHTVFFLSRENYVSLQRPNCIILMQTQWNMCVLEFEIPLHRACSRSRKRTIIQYAMHLKANKKHSPKNLHVQDR